MKLLYSFELPEGERLDEPTFLSWTRAQFFPSDVVKVNIDQKVGCAIDGWIGGRAIEIKDDLASRDTHNLFIETGQRFPGGDWIESGLTLAAQQADIYLHCAYTKTRAIVFGFNPKKLFDYVRTVTRRVETRTGANGNRPGAYARGRLLPFLGQDGLFLTQFLLEVSS